MNKEEFSLDIDMSKADMSKLKDLLTSKLGLRHFAFQLKTGEYLDLVEYKDYEKLEKEHQKMNGDLRIEIKELKDRIDKAFEIIDLIKPELWNISNKMTYRLLDVKTTLKGDKE